jgi:hypothetical protein
MAIAEDVSTPAVVHTTTNASTPGATTAAFSPPAGSLLVVVVNILFNAGQTTGTLTVSDSVSGTWTAGPTSGAGSVPNTLSAIFYRYLSTAPGSITVSVTNSNKAAGSVSLAVRVVNGANPVQVGAASSNAYASTTTTAMSEVVTTTKAGSTVYFCAGIVSHTTTYTALAGTTTVDDFQDTTSGHQGFTGVSAALTSVTGTVTLGWTLGTASAFTWAALEILPAAAGGIAATAAGNTAVATTLVIPNPAYVSGATPVGVLVVIWITASVPSETFTCPGFTAVTAATGQNTAAQILYRTTDGTEVSTFTVTAPASHFQAGGAVSFPGMGALDPVPTSSGTLAAAYTTSLPAPAITTVMNGDTLIWAGMTRVASGTIPTITPPSGFTSLALGTSSGVSTGANIGVLIASAPQVSAGSTSAVGTGSQSISADGGAVLFAVSPASAGRHPRWMTQQSPLAGDDEDDEFFGAYV